MTEFQKYSRAYIENYDKVFESLPHSNPESATPLPTRSPESPAEVDGSGLPVPASPLDIRCPYCQALPHQPCRSVLRDIPFFHETRVAHLRANLRRAGR